MVENAWREARGLPIIQGGGETTPSTVNRSGGTQPADPSPRQGRSRGIQRGTARA